MLFNQAVLAQKMHHIDTTPMPLVHDVVKNVFGDVPFAISRKARVWFPGGGADLFVATFDGQTVFIKAKHKSLLIESRLESEPEFSSLSALENEVAFLRELAPSPHVPKVLEFTECDNYLLVILEALEPFEAIEIMTPEEQVDAYNALERFVQDLYEKGIVHTDIHEHNICFRGKTPVLVDFEEAKRLRQNVPFALSLDVTGAVGGDDVGQFPVQSNHDTPGLTCLNRLKKVFCKKMKPLLPAYLSQCNFDNTSTYNLDVEQIKDERVYQSILLPGLNIKGQRPVADKRLRIVTNTIAQVAQSLGRPVHVVDLGSNMGMVSFSCASSASVASVQGLEADPRYVSAARVLAFYSDNQEKVCFTEYMTGEKPYQWQTDVLLLLSVYHHIPDKDAFLQEILAQKPSCVIGEFATQERYYAERKSVEDELAHIKRTLNFSCAEVIAISEDYHRPIVVFHNGSPGVMAACNATPVATVSGKPDRSGLHTAPALPRSTSVQKSLAWLKNNSLRQKFGQGVVVSSRQQIPYPEVTGYCIPSLLHWGEVDLAMQYACWLASIQNPDGSFPGPNTKDPFAFDTGQVIRGFAAILPAMPELEPALVRACDWIVDTASPQGQIILPTNMADWSLGKHGSVNEAIHLYVLPGLEQAGEILGTTRYKAFVRHSLGYYINNCNLTNFLASNMLLHFYCYIQEALFDLGAIDICKTGMRELAERQKNSGMVPAYAGASWICSPGLIQSGLVWYKLGDYQRADKVLRVVEGIQGRSGGFVGSIGTDADYFPEEELSWAVKFYLDAIQLRLTLADKDKKPEFSYKANAEVVADLPVAYAAGTKQTDEHRAVPKAAEPPSKAALIPLQQGIIRLVERYACALLHKASTETGLDMPDSKYLAMAIPSLLAWGRRALALQCASALEKAVTTMLNAPQPLAPQGHWFTFALWLRALRQPEVVKQCGNELLRQICEYSINNRSSLADEDNLSFLASLYEVHTCASIVGGEELGKAIAPLVTGCWTPRSQVNVCGSFLQIRAVTGFVSQDAGLLLLQKALKDAISSQGMAPSWESVLHLGALAQAAWELGDDATAEQLFQKMASMLEILHKTTMEPGVDHTCFMAATIFLDAFTAKLYSSFAEVFPQFHEHIDQADGRLAFVMKHLPNASGATILDLGCAKGRYIRHIHEKNKNCVLYAEDIHQGFVSHIPAGITTGIGSMLRTSHEDATLDAVLLCEVLEHCVDVQAVITELYRIVKENGRVIIVDKDMRALAAWQGELPPWEQWFDVQKLAVAFQNQGFRVITTEENVAYEGNRRNGLFFGMVLEKIPAGGEQKSVLEEQKNTSPLVSIVLPTFNHLAYLPLAIDSILTQTYSNFELIVVDDGSEDGTGAYLDTLTSPKIRSVRGPNSRLPSALNRGFAVAQGDLLSWTSADNICLPNFLHTLVGALNAYPQAGFAYGPFDYIDANGQVCGKIAGQELSLHASIASNTGVASFMYRRSVAERVGLYDPKVEGAEDWDMWLRMLETTTPVYANAAMYQYRHHHQSMTVSIPKKVRVASERVAVRSLERIEKSGGITKFFPQIEHCADREKALFYAHRELGSRMLYPHSFLKKYAFRYLEVAYGMNAQDLCTVANYAIALECNGQHAEALRILGNASGLFAATQLEPVAQFIAKARGRIQNPHETMCPILVDTNAPANELMQKVQAGRLVFTP